MSNYEGELWKIPTTLNVFVKEYEIWKVLSTSEANLSHSFKRKFLCASHYHFFDDSDEDELTKVELTITDDHGTICFKKTYSQVDNINRRFFTNQ